MKFAAWFPAGAISWRRKRIGRSCGGQLRKFRIGLAPVMLSGRAQRATPRRVSAGATQDPGLQLAAGAPSSALRSGVAAVLARRAARPHLPPSLVVALAQARTLRHAARLSRAGRPRLLAGAPPRGRALALFPVPALARRRGSHLPPAARDRARIRRGAIRLHGRRGRAGCRPCAGVLRARGAGAQAAVPRAPLVQPGAS